MGKDEKDPTDPEVEVPTTLRSLLGSGGKDEQSRDGEVHIEEENKK